MGGLAKKKKRLYCEEQIIYIFYSMIDFGQFICVVLSNYNKLNVSLWYTYKCILISLLKKSGWR